VFLLRRVLYYLASLFTLVRGVRNWPSLIRLINPGPDGVILTLRDGSRYAVRSMMEAWIVKETCLDRNYERYGAAIRDGWTVVDIGAGPGEFAVFTARRAPNSRIFAYEPAPDSAALLEKNLKLNQVRNVEVHAHAVSDKDGFLMLDLSSGVTTQCGEATGARGTGKRIMVRCLALADVLSGLPGGVCHYLKMDCEGAEYGMLLNLDQDALARVRRICLEYHEYAAPHSREDLVQLFQRRGWRVRLSPSKVRRELGFLYAVAPSDRQVD